MATLAERLRRMNPSAGPSLPARGNVPPVLVERLGVRRANELPPIAPQSRVRIEPTRDVLAEPLALALDARALDGRTPAYHRVGGAEIAHPWWSSAQLNEGLRLASRATLSAPVRLERIGFLDLETTSL